MDVLVLCTGNICRSPMAQALLTAEAEQREVGANVTSAGFLTEDLPAEPCAVDVMATRGLDLGHHRSRQCTPRMLADADLVIAMTREHVRWAYEMWPEGFFHTFTLKELVRRGTEVGPVTDDLDCWLDVVAEERESAHLLGNSRADDIEDPMGRSLRRFRACANEIEANIIALADLLWPPDAP